MVPALLEGEGGEAAAAAEESPCGTSNACSAAVQSREARHLRNSWILLVIRYASRAGTVIAVVLTQKVRLRSSHLLLLGCWVD